MAQVDQLEKIRRTQEEEEAQGLAKKLGLFYINLFGYPITSDVLNLIPKETAQKYRAISYLRALHKWRVAIPNPKNQETRQIIETIAQAANLEIIYAVCSESSID